MRVEASVLSVSGLGMEITCLVQRLLSGLEEVQAARKLAESRGGLLLAGQEGARSLETKAAPPAQLEALAAGILALRPRDPRDSPRRLLLAGCGNLEVGVCFGVSLSLFLEIALRSFLGIWSLSRKWIRCSLKWTAF